MVSKLLKLLNKDISTINQAALVLAIFSFLSQIFGLIRDRLLASTIGPSASLDVYYAAFRIPDFIYVSIASLFAVTVVIPFITKYIDSKNDLKNFSNSVFTVYSVGMVLISAIVFILMPYLAKMIAPGFSYEQIKDLVLFSRIMLLSPFLMGLSSLLGAFAQVQKKFLSFAIAPVFYNLGILFGILFLLPYIGILGVVIGVVIGALMHLLVQIPSLLNVSTLPKFVYKVDYKMIWDVIKISLPRTLTLSLTNITMIILGAVASLLVAGSISVFQLSYNIENTPLLIIGVSYAVSAFPTITKLFMDGKKEEFLEVVHRAIRNILFLAIPASILLIVLRAQIVRVLLGAGNFSWNDTRLVAASVALFCLSIVAQCLVLIFVRGFYAMNNTKKPLFINLLSVAFTAVSLVLLLYLFENYQVFRSFIESLLRVEGVSGTSVLMLPLAFSIGQVFNAIFLWISFHRSTGIKIENKNFIRAAFHTFGSGIISGAATYVMLVIMGKYVVQSTFWGIFLQGFVAGIFGILVYAMVLILLENEDIDQFIKTLKSKFWKQKPIAPEKVNLQ